MTKRTQVAETKEINAIEAIRQGWLAYLGAYGLVYDRATPKLKSLAKRYSEFFGDLVEKGEEVEATAIEQIEDVRDRAKGVYDAGFEKFRSILPAQEAANDRPKAAKKKVAAPAKKRSVKSKSATTKTAKAA